MRNYAPMYAGAGQLAKAFAATPYLQGQGQAATAAEAFKQALTQSQIDKNDAASALDAYRLHQMQTGPDEFLAGVVGRGVEDVGVLREALAKGFQDRADGPPTAAGEVPTISTRQAWMTPEVVDRFNQGRATLGLNSAGTGATNASQLADAFSKVGTERVRNELLQGRMQPGSVAAAFGAVDGKPTVDVTASGIAYNRYGDAGQPLNTGPFDARIAAESGDRRYAADARAQAMVDAAMVRAKGTGKPPAEQQLVEYYRQFLPLDQAIQMAKSRKGMSTRDIALEVYLNALSDPTLMDNQDTPDVNEAEVAAQDRAFSAIRFLEDNADRLGGVPREPAPTSAAQPGSVSRAFGGAMVELPPPQFHPGRVAVDQSTGKRYQSDGHRWLEIK